MDNAQKAIMIGVGLFITIIIISVVLLITNLGKEMTDTASGELRTMSSQLQNSLKKSYDNKTTNGAEVLTLYHRYEGNPSFLLVFDVDLDNDHAHNTNNTELHYNNNGFAAPFAGISRKGGQMSVNYNRTAPLPTDGRMPTRISSLLGANSISTLISSSDVYQTYLIYDGETIIGVYARLRATLSSGTRGMSTDPTAVSL